MRCRLPARRLLSDGPPRGARWRRWRCCSLSCFDPGRDSHWPVRDLASWQRYVSRPFAGFAPANDGFLTNPERPGELRFRHKAGERVGWRRHGIAVGRVDSGLRGRRRQDAGVPLLRGGNASPASASGGAAPLAGLHSTASAATFTLRSPTFRSSPVESQERNFVTKNPASKGRTPVRFQDFQRIASAK
jgi:hypothetical protein